MNLESIESYKEEHRFSKYLNRFTRFLFFLIGDTFSLLFAAIFTYIILSPLTIPARSFPIEHALIITGSLIAGLFVFQMYFATWRYTSLRDLIKIIAGIFAGGVISIPIAHFFIEFARYEYAFTVMMLINAVLLLGGFRISKRVYFEFVNSNKSNKKHTIIFGGKSEGEQILRDILKNDWNLSVQGIFDDRLMPGLLLHGVRIRGGKDEMIAYLRVHPVDELIVAFPEIPKKDLKEIIEEIKSISPEMSIKVLPSFHSLTDDAVGIEHIRDISIEDILGREPVKIDMNTIKAGIFDKTVLVTGGGGSIGSELVRQCANLEPEKLIALDIDETELFHIENELKGSKTEIIPCVANVADEQKMDRIMALYQPEVIFHAAAYKHVPMMESFPEEAIKVNIGGTLTLASLACKHEVDKFIMVSTDKAVNPTNVMGATKRVAEEICSAYNGTCLTKFISVRFGNVLGSRGSVVPLFIEQIKNGGPVTVTDPEVERYFMTIPEAVLLIIKAGSMGLGGEVFVLDMGSPVKIIDMAEDLIRLHNLTPGRDIDIEITGLRPGEKLYEELLNDKESLTETEHSEIFKTTCSRNIPAELLQMRISDLLAKLENGSSEDIRYHLQTLVPTYTYKGNAKVNGFPKRKKPESITE